MSVVEDMKALRIQLLQWAKIEQLARILAAQGPPIEEHPRQVLLELAELLA